MQRIPEPCPVCFPKPLIAKEKIVGNIIELNNPTSKIDHIAKEPKVDIEIITSNDAIIALNPSILPGFIFRCTAEPINLPTMAPPQ